MTTFEQYWQYWMRNHGRKVLDPPDSEIILPQRRDNPVPSPWLPRVVLRDNPEPSPWLPAVYELVQAASVKQAATTLPEGAPRADLEAGASQAIEDILDDWCGTHSHRPWPPPPPWAVPIAVELTQIANSYQAGHLRDELLGIAGQALQKGLSATAAEGIST
jgi:hypothetical protein